MPYNPDKPSRDLKARIKKRYPRATSKQIRLFTRVFNSVYEKSKDESKAFAAAWSQLGKSVRKKRKKKAEIVEFLIKLANELDHSRFYDEADQIDLLMEEIIKS